MKFFIWALLFLFLLTIQAAAQQPDQDDNQIWHETILTILLTEQVNLTFNGGLRFGFDAERFVDQRAGFGFSYKVNKYFAVSTGYLYRKTEFVPGRKNYENRLIGNFILRHTFGKIDLSDRNQFEYQARNSRSDKFNYRNRLQIERETSIKGFKIKPFASAEVFYDSQFEAFSRLRLIAGAGRKFNKNLTLDAYYLRQQDGQSRPGDLNVFGTTLRIHL
ncbi:MAG: DUF2490 domain-containing protein [Pyrinomonadaceae bacterium]